MGGDLFYDLGFLGLPGGLPGVLAGVAVAGGGFGFGEVEAGDLEAVEEQACSARVDLVGGDALEDLADGVLDGGPVFGERQVEGGSAALALGGVRDGFAGGVVVVAEVFSAEAWAAAAGAVDEDVAALVAFRFGVVHFVPSPRGTCFGQSPGKTGVKSGPALRCLSIQQVSGSLCSFFAVKCGGPAFGRAFFVFLYCFYFTKLEQTKLPLLVKIFFGAQVVSFVIFIEDLPRAC